ncbi:guanylate kinase [Ravibacter arvi]|uniref:Guanylate kinase n=1 Tax=Ravibacter arvi TaxID=2051041 RepID=A0ABP8M7V4_9BACT
MSPQGKLIIFSAPSGSGKTTIVRHLLQAFPEKLAFSISACTREPRAHEVDGADYYFLSPETFREKIANGEFVEWEEVYRDNFYGTLRAEIERLWKSGRTVVFDVDVKGGLKLKEVYKDQALAIFVGVSSEEEIYKRLNARGTENEASLNRRMEKVRYESGFKDQFDVVLWNDRLEDTLAKAEVLVENFLNRP